MKEKRSILAVGIYVGIGLLLVSISATFLTPQVKAQPQQTMPGEGHHTEKNNTNQSRNVIEQEHHYQQQLPPQQQNLTTTTFNEMVTNNQTLNTKWISLVNGVIVTGISIIDSEHVAINLHYGGEGEPPGTSVVAAVMGDITNSFAGTIMESNMAQNYSMDGHKGEIMSEKTMGAMTGNQQQLSNSTMEQQLQHHQYDAALNSTSTTISNNIHLPIPSIKSGSNYIEAGWYGRESNSATLFVQLDGDFAEELGGRHIIMLGLFPFLHR
jgi:hypothetical protein